jgi:hypothetical protein
MYGNSNDADISINTYYNTLDTCIISWNIITDSMPSNWEFSICFPTCFNIGVTSGQDFFNPNEQAYLNCHMYPNGQVGVGVVQMEVITNNLSKDTITWIGYISNTTFVTENITNRKLLKRIDLLGRETKKTDTPLLYIYDDGTIETRIIVE